MASLKEQIIAQLDSLPPELQRSVLDFTRALANSKIPKGVPGKVLLRFAKTIAHEELQRITQAIEAGCEQINRDDWQIPS